MNVFVVPLPLPHLADYTSCRQWTTWCILLLLQSTRMKQGVLVTVVQAALLVHRVSGFVGSGCGKPKSQALTPPRTSGSYIAQGMMLWHVFFIVYNFAVDEMSLLSLPPLLCYTVSSCRCSNRISAHKTVRAADGAAGWWWAHVECWDPTSGHLKYLLYGIGPSFAILIRYSHRQ